MQEPLRGQRRASRAPGTAELHILGSEEFIKGGGGGRGEEEEKERERLGEGREGGRTDGQTEQGQAAAERNPDTEKAPLVTMKGRPYIFSTETGENANRDMHPLRAIRKTRPSGRWKVQSAPGRNRGSNGAGP